MTRRAYRIFRTLLNGAAATTFAGFVLWVIFETYVAALPMPDLALAGRLSPVVLADDRHILKAYLSRDGYWRLKTTPHDVPQYYLTMLLAYEDKRFLAHVGVDPRAVIRAFLLLIEHGRIVSGASTLTMQVVRLLDAGKTGFLGKIRQAALAIKLERRCDKETILTLYMTLAPFGGNVQGVRAASLRYFGKEPEEMSVAEAALLVALPQSPENCRPDLDEKRAAAARDFVLRLMAARHVIDAGAVAQALREKTPRERSVYAFLAPHLTDRLRAENPNVRVIATSVDRRLQARLETLAAELVMRQPDSANVAILVVRTHDLAVRAYVGGGNYFDADRAGMLDLVRAVRSPGSTLKPIIYGMAFEDLVVHPNTVVGDDAVRFQGYAPENFDKKYRGDLSVRDALLLSVNTVAVVLLNQVGAERFLSRLRAAGVKLELPDETAPPGLALALGGVGIDLENLAKVFAGIANRGRVAPLRFLADAPRPAVSRLISADAAWAVADILANAPPPPGRIALRSRDGGRRLGYKTGTSYGFRDAWSVGFDSDHVVAVWIGRPDGISRRGETGASLAMPLMQQVFDTLPVPESDVAADPPRQSVLARSTDLPDRLKFFAVRETNQTRALLTRPLQIRFPVDGSTIKLIRLGSEFMPLTISATGGHAPFRWFVDGKLASIPSPDAMMVWRPEGRGQVEIMIMDADGQRASAKAWLD